MFHLAFTEKGASSGRPTSGQWVQALDGLRKQLKKCSASGMHLFPGHLPKCPWCELEREGVIYFLDIGTTFTRTASGFVLQKAWALIEAVPSVPAVQIPDVDNIPVRPSALPAGVPSDGTIVFYRLVVVCLTAAVLFNAPKSWFFALVGGFIGWGVAGSFGSGSRAEERSRRQTVASAARDEFEQLVQQLKAEAGPEGFSAKRAELMKARDEYQRLPDAEKHEIDKLHSTAYDRQKQKFLDGFFIDSASIAGVGPARKAALRSFGIETAADCDRNRVRQVRGFGEGLTAAVMDWKASCERRFQFNPATGVSEADKNQVRGRFAARRSAIESLLNGGPAELQRYKQQAAARAERLRPKLETAAHALAQARVDLSVVST